MTSTQTQTQTQTQTVSGNETRTLAGQLPLRQYGVLLLVCFALFLPGFFALPVTDRDEARFAQASRQMLESGDYVNISFQNRARHKKPVGVYWLQAASTAVFGSAERAEIWTYRLPSLLSAVIAVLGTAWLGARFFGPRAGLFGGLMLAGTLLLGSEARLAKTDATLLASILVAQAALGAIYLARRRGESAGWLAALVFWAALGVSVLIKGPIIFLVSGGTILFLLAIERKGAWLKDLRPVTGFLLAALMVLPWFIAIGVQTDWAFFKSSLGHDLFAKLASGQESHGAPPGYYFIAFWPGFWPFSMLAVLMVPWAWARRKEPAVRFCIAWILPTWVVLEIVVTKLPHYIMPVFPAIAVLTAAAWQDAFQGGGPRLRKISAFVAVTGFIICGAIFAGLFAVGTGFLEKAPNIAGVALGIVTVALLVYGLVWRFRGLDHAVAPLSGLLIGSWLFTGALFQFVLPSLHPIWLSERVADLYQQHRACPESRLLASGYTEPSLVFRVGTDTLLGDGAAIAGNLIDDPKCSLALIEQRAADVFFATLKKHNKEVEPLATLHGIAYARGKRAELTLYRLR